MNGQRDTIFEIAKNMKIDLDEGQKFISENLDKLAIDLEQNSKKFSFPFFNWGLCPQRITSKSYSNKVLMEVICCNMLSECIKYFM